MKSPVGTLAAPFPWFGGKSRACKTVWTALGNPDNYVEPLAGSAAMLLGRPEVGHVETINDSDGFVANFWRAIAHDASAVADAADWPCNESDLFARHSYLVRHAKTLIDSLHASPGYFDAKLAGWWCWGLCNWIGSGWCDGNGRWVHDGERIVDSKLFPHLRDSGNGINRKLPHLGDAGQGINRQLPKLGNAGLQSDSTRKRSEFIHAWFDALKSRLRHVRVCCGDWSRVTKESVTTYHGLTGVFLDPPYTKGEMDYVAKGTGGKLASEVREWCVTHGGNPLLRIVICGHSGEHDELLGHGWHIRKFTNRRGYAATDAAIENSAGETLWCSPHCVPLIEAQAGLFGEVA